MYRDRIGSSASGSLRVAEERHIVGGRAVVEILESDFHGTNGNSQFFESREEVEEVMWRKSKFGGLYIVGGEIESA